jgi:protein-disulfide isomerase
MSSLRGLLIAIAFGVLATAQASAAQFSAAQTTEIRSIIKDYLMEHPEVLRDAITELDEREKTAEADARKKALTDLAAQLYDAPDGFVIGNPSGKIKLVEFFDYNCGYCKKALPDLGRLIADNKDLKVILRDFPILSPSSVDAALFAVAAHNQFQGDKFWDFHRKLLSEHGLVGKEQAISIAQAMGADMGKLNEDAANPKARSAIQQSDALAKSLSLTGTPTYVVGDDVLVGAVGYDQISKTIGNVRKCGKAMCS